MIKLDDTDRQLIRLLQQNGRYTDQYLSIQLGISRITVKNRVQRLLAYGVIQITVTPDITRGYKSTGVIIGLKSDRWAVDALIEELTLHYQVVRVAKTSGRFDVIVLAWFLDTDELSNYILNVVSNIENHTCPK